MLQRKFADFSRLMALNTSFNQSILGHCVRSLNRPLLLGCVPEQVSIPLIDAIDSLNDRAHMELVKLDFIKEGTGRMVNMINEGSLDISIACTDALLRSCALHPNLAIIGDFTVSPLVWACTAASDSQFTQMMDISGLPQLRVGVSRVGSGSHTIAAYFLNSLPSPPQLVSFVPCNNIAGLLSAVQQGNIDVFFWEHFTSMPHFRSHAAIRHVGDVKTPWSSFSYFMNTANEEIRSIIDTIFPLLFPAIHQEYLLPFTSVENTTTSIERIMSNHHHTQIESNDWLSSTTYSQTGVWPSVSKLQQTLDILSSCNLLTPPSEGNYRRAECVSMDDGKVQVRWV